MIKWSYISGEEVSNQSEAVAVGSKVSMVFRPVAESHKLAMEKIIKKWTEG